MFHKSILHPQTRSKDNVNSILSVEKFARYRQAILLPESEIFGVALNFSRHDQYEPARDHYLNASGETGNGTAHRLTARPLSQSASGSCPTLSVTLPWESGSQLGFP